MTGQGKSLLSFSVSDIIGGENIISYMGHGCVILDRHANIYTYFYHFVGLKVDPARDYDRNNIGIVQQGGKAETAIYVKPGHTLKPGKSDWGVGYRDATILLIYTFVKIMKLAPPFFFLFK